MYCLSSKVLQAYGLLSGRRLKESKRHKEEIIKKAKKVKFMCEKEIKQHTCMKNKAKRNKVTIKQHFLCE